jgi:ABC-2 type transport system ATP-binding protein
VAVRARLAYVPGELRLPDRTTGGRLVDAIARIRGAYDPARRDELSERLKVDLSRETRQLSSGNRRKLALLLAFLWPAELIVLDEPTSGLDPLMQHEFLGLVRRARDDGSTVFLSSHVLSEVQQAADRVVVLRGGLVVAEGSVDELQRRVSQRVEVWFEGPAPQEAAAIEGLAECEIDGRRFTAVLVGPVGPLLGFLAGRSVERLQIAEPDLEEAFLEIYQAAS